MPGGPSPRASCGAGGGLLSGRPWRQSLPPGAFAEQRSCHAPAPRGYGVGTIRRWGRSRSTASGAPARARPRPGLDGFRACPGARPGIRGGNGPGAARLYPGQAPRQARNPSGKSNRRAAVAGEPTDDRIWLHSVRIGHSSSLVTRQRTGVPTPIALRCWPAVVRRERTYVPKRFPCIGNIGSLRDDGDRRQTCVSSRAHPLHSPRADGAKLTGGLAG